MTRPWGKLHASMLSHSKNIRLTPMQRSAWVTLLMHALNSPSDDLLGEREDLEAILRIYGHDDPAGILAVLVKLRLLEAEDGEYRLHDWADWQPDDPTGSHRKAAWRKAQKAAPSRDGDETVPGQSPDSPRTITRLSRPRGEERREEEKVPPARPREASPKNGPAPAASSRRGTGFQRVGDVAGRIDWGQALTATQRDEWSDFGDEWRDVKAAWLARGLKHPPAGSADDDGEANSQRHILFEILDSRPTDLPRWIREAPRDRSAAGVVAHCLTRWREIRAKAAEPRSLRKATA